MGFDDEGWIKLHRKLVKSRVFQNASLLKVFIWCLLKASHEKEWVPIKTGRGETEVEVDPGQFIFGRKGAAKKLKMPLSSIRNRIEKLKNMQILDTQPDTHYTMVTIINWHPYQDKKIKEDSKEDNQRTTKGQPKDTYKNDKNVKKDIRDSKESLVDTDASTTGKVEVVTKSCPHQEIIFIYHDTLPELNQIKVWDDTAKGYLRARWREDPERQMLCWWKAFFIFVKGCPFLMGHNDRGWQADLRWLVKPTNFAKVMNGNYNRNKRPFSAAIDFIEGDGDGE